MPQKHEGLYENSMNNCMPKNGQSGRNRQILETYNLSILDQKEKRLIDMDNSVVIAGGRWYKGTKWQWENTIKLNQQ